MARLDIDHLSISYGTVPVVRDLSLVVEDGECLALLGPSGCGKSTTLRAVAGFVQASGGSIRIGGRDMAGCAPHARNIGLVFQDYALFPHMTVAQNVAYGLRRRGCTAAETRTRVREALQMVRLDQHMDRHPAMMSGGQRQRVALARAIVIRPDVLLLDEPLGALHRKLRDQMQDELKTLQAQLGYTCIIVTHDQEEALSLASRVALMIDGDIAEIGPPAELYSRPRSAQAMDFLGASSLFDAHVSHDRGEVRYDLPGGLSLAGPRSELPHGSPVQLGIRPECITVGSAPLGANSIQGTIRQVVYKGPSADVYIDGAGCGLRAIVETGGVSGRCAYTPGQEVWARINPDDLLVFPKDRAAR